MFNSQTFTLNLNLQPKIGLTNAMPTCTLYMANHLEFDHTRFPTIEAVTRLVRELLRHYMVNVNYGKSHESLNKYIPKMRFRPGSLMFIFSYFSLLIAFYLNYVIKKNQHVHSKYS